MQQVDGVTGSLRRGLGLVWVLCLLVAACGGAGNAPTGARVSVLPAASVEGQWIVVTATGLKPHEIVSLRMTSTDAMGVRWTSAATFAASGSGELDTNHDAARSGAYTGVWGAGLIATMTPTGPTAAGAYFWADTRPFRFTVTVQSRGQTIASSTFVRRFSKTTLTRRRQSLSTAGLTGTFYYPNGSVRRPAILLLGGSEGGIPSPVEAGLLAAQGYPVLALAYFNEPGLPQALQDIPLEYFKRALRWLDQQPQVDPAHVAVLGISRGSEAALLSGAYFPRLVHAVIAMVPSDAAICSYPGCQRPAWTVAGRAIPYTRQFNDPHPTDQPAAIIPVERIHGPIFLACGTDDQTWNSCAYANAIVDRLNTTHDPFRHPLYRYANAGHIVGSIVPDEPGWADLTDRDPQADKTALEADWPRLLRFLAAFSRSH